MLSSDSFAIDPFFPAKLVVLTIFTQGAPALIRKVPKNKNTENM